jgi:cytidylate kinase
MAVITISRQMGCLGHDVANEIAVCLNYKVVWREVINQAARRAGVPEMALATIDELDLLGLRPSARDRKAYHDAVREMMHELADEDNVVIVGRAGQVILRGQRNAYHVKLYAPIETRVERIAARHNLSIEAARTQVETSDLARKNYLKKYYNARWDDPLLYDLMLNTGLLNTQQAALTVCAALSHKLPAAAPSQQGISLHD